MKQRFKIGEYTCMWAFLEANLVSLSVLNHENIQVLKNWPVIRAQLEKAEQLQDVAWLQDQILDCVTFIADPTILAPVQKENRIKKILNIFKRKREGS